MKLVSGRDFLIAIPLANLCYLRLWAEIFCIGRPDAYFLKDSRVDVIAVAVNVLLLGSAFVLAAVVVRAAIPKHARVVLGVGLGLVIAMQANWFGPLSEPAALALLREWGQGRYWPMLLVLALLAGIVGLVSWKPRPALKVAIVVLQISAPFVLVTFMRAATILMTAEFPEEGKFAPPIAELPAPPGPRMVLVVFDGMGRDAAIDLRPADLALPEFDRLRLESIDATQATQPGSHTRRSIPALVSGVVSSSTSPLSPRDVAITSEIGGTKPWSELPNLFRETRERGGNALAVGWGLPYCRQFADDLSGCGWYATYTGGSVDAERPFSQVLPAQMTSLIPYADRAIGHAAAHRRIVADAKRAVAMPGAGFTLIHVNVPHEPYIYDRVKGEITVWNRFADAYWDNLALMDRVLGELRRTMEETGTWDSSTVLVTSDHSSKKAKHLTKTSDTQVPWVLKLAGQKEGAVYEQPFHAVLSYELARGVLAGEITEPAQAIAFLDARREESTAYAARAIGVPRAQGGLHRTRVRGLFVTAGIAMLAGALLLSRRVRQSVLQLRRRWLERSPSA